MTATAARRDAAITARRDAAWLVLEAPLPATVAASPWSLLAWNDAFVDGPRIVVTAGASGPVLRSDVPCNEDAPLASRTAAAEAGLAMARLHLAGAIPDPVIGPSAPRAGEPAAIVALCRATERPVHERADGTVIVDLDVAGAFHQARVEPGSDGRLVASVAILDIPLDATSELAVRRDAVARLLLRVGGMVRLVRAVRVAGEAGAPGFRVETDEESGALAFGLAALGLACRLGAAAATALAADDTIARLYLQHDGAAAIRAAA